MFYIDAPTHKRKGGRTTYAHLASPSRLALDDFAAAIGLSTCFRHAVRKHVHYDVPERLYQAAVEAGAIVVSSRELVSLCF
jgi:hypothetical protein